MVVCAAALLGLAPAQHPDDAGIRRAVQFYFDGSRHADSAAMRQAFQTDVAHMLSVRDGKVVDDPIPEFVRRTGARRAGGASFAPDTFTRRVVMVDIAGTSAIAKLETVTPSALIVDYMALLKVDGEWKVVNKIYDRLPKS
jgi:hypothetical protein